MKQTFTITEKIEVNCRTFETNHSWGHVAELYINGISIGSRRITYYNRTWESYTFQSVLGSVIEKYKKHFTEEELELCKKFIENPNRSDEDPEMASLKTIGMIAMLGDVMTASKEESNKWKIQMLKAGLEKKGLSFPDDFDQLDEKTQEERLNQAIAIIS